MTSRSSWLVALVVGALFSLGSSLAEARDLVVSDDASLARALAGLGPGDVVRIEAGTYRGGHHLREVSGTPAGRIVIRADDAEHPPVFEGGGGTAFHLSGCHHLTVQDLVVRGYPHNGVNIDDGGTSEPPSRSLLLERLRIEDTGPRGNHDGLKLSGLVDFVVRGCSFVGWGGSAIDMVGCRRGVVEDCRFEGREGYSQSNAVQMKGGTREVLVQTSDFIDCGHRSVNLGGSTGLAYFRPEVASYEATAIEVAGNRFSGSAAPIAFVTAQGGHVHHNTFLYPGKWVLRILQETEDDRFALCRGGRFENNLVVFDERVRIFVNVGPRTLPHSFRFSENAWLDTEGTRRPLLPTREKGSVLQPRVEVGTGADGRPLVERRDGRLKDIGAAAYVKPEGAKRPTRLE